MILKNTKPQTGNLSDMRLWQWVYLPVDRFGAKQPGIEIKNPRKMQRWQYGDRLLIRPGPDLVNPRDGKGYAGIVNSYVAQRGQTYTPKRGKNKGVSSTRNHGFMRQTVAAMKRRAQFKGLTIYASFTTFNNANEVSGLRQAKARLFLASLFSIEARGPAAADTGIDSNEFSNGRH